MACPLLLTGCLTDNISMWPPGIWPSSPPIPPVSVAEVTTSAIERGSDVMILLAEVLKRPICAKIALDFGRDVTEEDLKKFLADKVSPIEMPRKIIIRTKPLPRTAIGKPDKKAILAEEGLVRPVIG